MSIENEPRNIEDDMPEEQESESLSEFEILEEPEQEQQEQMEPEQESEKPEKFQEYEKRLKLSGKKANEQEKIDKKERGLFSRLKKDFRAIGGAGVLAAAFLSGCGPKTPEGKEALAKRLKVQEQTVAIQEVTAENLEIMLEREKQYLITLIQTGEKDKIKATEQRMKELERRIKETRELKIKKEKIEEEKPSTPAQPWSVEEWGPWGMGRKTTEKPGWQFGFKIAERTKEAELSRINELIPEVVRTEAKDILDYLMASGAITKREAITSRTTGRGFLFNLGRFGAYEVPPEKIKDIIGARELINMAAKKVPREDAPGLASRRKIEQFMPHYVMKAIIDNGLIVKGGGIREMQPEETKADFNNAMRQTQEEYSEKNLPLMIPDLQVIPEGLKYKIVADRVAFAVDKSDLLKLTPRLEGVNQENARLEQLYVQRAQQSWQREQIQPNRELIKQQSRNQITKAIKSLQK